MHLYRQNYKRSKAAYEAIHDLLVHHGNPTFTIMGQHHLHEEDRPLKVGQMKPVEEVARECRLLER